MKVVLIRVFFLKVLLIRVIIRRKKVINVVLKSEMSQYSWYLFTNDSIIMGRNEYLVNLCPDQVFL
jgi:hypothetical protein